MVEEIRMKQGCFAQCSKRVGKFFRQILIRRKNKVSPAPSTSTTCVKACENGTNERPRPTEAENSHKSREENGVGENESTRADNETGLENFVNEFVTDELKKISSMFLVTSVGEDGNVGTTDMKVNVEEQTAPTP